jgi:hypothetical protein
VCREIGILHVPNVELDLGIVFTSGKRDRERDRDRERSRERNKDQERGGERERLIISTDLILMPSMTTLEMSHPRMS